MMALDLFAGNCVSDYEAAKAWYERLLGGEPCRGIASRGIEPDERVTYPGKARKAIYRDADGNEIGFGGAVDSAGS